MSSPDLLPSLPSLSSDLAVKYQELDFNMRRLFIQVFKYLWRVVHSRRFIEPPDLVGCYWALDLLRVRCDLTNSQFCLLTYIYQVSNKGTEVIHSDQIKYGSLLNYNLPVSKGSLLTVLRRAGYISRFNRIPGAPHLAINVDKHKVFIRMTVKGVQLIQGIERDMYKILLNSSLNDLTGANKKPG